MPQMNLKLIIAVSVLAAMPTLALAQAGGAAPPKGQAAPPKPTKAAAEKVVQIISADKARIATYCSIGSLYEQMDQAREKKNQKQMQDLSKQIQALSAKLGPEYSTLMAGYVSADPQSKEAKEVDAVFETLDKQCPK
jgi:hypothetical protein